MKKKILIITSLITFIALLFLNFYKVEAVTEGETDTKKETTAEGENKKEATASEEWTDFSKAKFN